MLWVIYRGSEIQSVFTNVADARSYESEYGGNLISFTSYENLVKYFFSVDKQFSKLEKEMHDNRGIPVN